MFLHWGAQTGEAQGPQQRHGQPLEQQERALQPEEPEQGRMLPGFWRRVEGEQSVHPWPSQAAP